MDDLIERVAKALYDSRFERIGMKEYTPWEQVVPVAKITCDEFRADARAAIAAIAPFPEIERALASYFEADGWDLSCSYGEWVASFVEVEILVSGAAHAVTEALVADRR